MFLLRYFQFLDASGQFLMARQQFAHPNEGPDDQNIHLNRPRAAEDRGQHSYSMLGEGVGQITPAAWQT